jgi:hypothetical protein
MLASRCKKAYTFHLSVDRAPALKIKDLPEFWEALQGFAWRGAKRQCPENHRDIGEHCGMRSYLIDVQP